MSSAARMRTTKSNRNQPYNASIRPATRSFPPHPSATSLASPTSSAAPGNTVRDAFLETIRERFPNFQPRNDAEILALSSCPIRGDEEEIRRWLDELLAYDLASTGRTVDAMIADAASILDIRDGITGLKPRPDTPNVFTRPIPNTPYSIRLFPGSAHTKEYCLDFVRTRDGTAVNSPFKFELWQLPSPSYAQFFPPLRIRSLEYAFGHKQKDTLPGEEKFVLQDGMTYIIRRRNHRDVRFTVPIRAQNLPASVEDVDDLDFPSVVP